MRSDYGIGYPCEEKLLGTEGIRLSDETLRRWLIAAGLWKERRKRSPNRQWRPRRTCFGEMVQLDGSHHDWLEGRSPKLVLMAISMMPQTRPMQDFMIMRGQCRPWTALRVMQSVRSSDSVYLDRHTTYKSSKKFTQWDDVET